MTKEEIFVRLNELSADPNFIYTLSAIIIRDFSGTLEDLSNKNPFDHLNNKEIWFLMGLWIKNWDSKKTPNPSKNESDDLDEVYQLMEQFHFTFLSKNSEINIQNTDIYDFFNTGKHFQETIFYSADGAYDYQYTKWVTEKYKYDKNWLETSKSINLDILPDFYHTIKTLQQKKLNSLKSDPSVSRKDQILDIFILSKEEILEKNKDFEGILKNFVLDIDQPANTNFSDIGDFNILAEKPIIKLPNGKLFIPMPYYLSEAIYESPFYWMNSDSKYAPKALFNRGEIAEEITYDIIKGLFGNTNTVRNLLIGKSRSSTLTDIDILAYYKDIAIIFQVKSKKLTALSKKGDIDSIQSDFKKAVKDAYEQGLIASQCLFKPEEYLFRLKDNPNYKFDLQIRKSFVVTIVLDDYPGITHQTHILLGKDYEEFPVALNIFDLEVIAKYLDSPSKFTDYIERRVKFSKYYKADNELGLLGFHLKRGLQKFPDAEFVGLDNSWAQFFDHDYYGEISGINTTKEKPRKKIGRNEKCPCGSGIKYKKCHGKK